MSLSFTVGVKGRGPVLVDAEESRLKGRTHGPGKTIVRLRPAGSSPTRGERLSKFLEIRLREALPGSIIALEVEQKHLGQLLGHHLPVEVIEGGI